LKLDEKDYNKLKIYIQTPHPELPETQENRS